MMQTHVKPKLSLSFLIPAYNDGATIERVVTIARAVGSRLARRFEIIVINDASTDRTGVILTGLQKKIRELHVTTHRANYGYGQTIKELYYAGKYEWLFTVPGDYQIDPTEVQKLLPHTARADMIIGLRVNRNDPAERLRQSKLYNWLLRVLFGLRLHDVNSVRLIRQNIFKRIHLESTSAFVDAELAMKANRLGFRTLEVPIAHRPREGSPGGGGNWYVIIPTIVDMIKFVFI